MAANPDDPHWSVGKEDALAGNPRYAFQDAVNQARYDRGYAEGEMQSIADEYGRRAQEMPVRLTKGLANWTQSFDAFEQRMRAKGLVRG